MARFPWSRKLETRDPDPFPPWAPPIWNQNLAGVAITADSTLGVTTVWRCIDLISSTVASLSVHVYRGGERIETPRVVLHPNPTESRIDTYSALINSTLLRGNGYALLGDFDRFGHAQQFQVLNPEAVQVRLNDQTGAVTYRLGDSSYTGEEILHLRGFVRPGHITGSGVLDLHKHSLGLAIAEHEWTERIFSEGSIPSGVISTEADMTPDSATELKRAWISAHGGRDRSPAVLSGGLKYTPIQMSNSDLELLSARKWSATQLAAMFGVPPSLCGAPSEESLTYSTVEQNTRSFVKFGLRPWIVRLEEALSSILPRGQGASIALGEYLQPDLLTRMQAAEIAVRNGFKSVEEIRAEENLT